LTFKDAQINFNDAQFVQYYTLKYSTSRLQQDMFSGVIEKLLKVKC